LHIDLQRQLRSYGLTPYPFNGSAVGMRGENSPQKKQTVKGSSCCRVLQSRD
jgi:hypothetical protein